MTDYNKLTVANLKLVVKERKIPLTGLIRKQQYVDRLLEDDASRGATSHSEGTIETAPPTADNAANGDGTSGAAAQDQPDTDVEDGPPTTRDGGDVSLNALLNHESEEAPADAALPDAPKSTKTLQTLHAEEPTQPSADAPSTVPDPTVLSTRSDEPVQDTADVQATANGAYPSHVPLQTSEAKAEVPSTEVPAEAITQVIMPSSPAQGGGEELAEDSKKRKRRSLSPAVREDSVSKKLKQIGEGGIVQLEEDVTGEQAGKETDVVVGEEKMDGGATATVLPYETSDDVMDVTASKDEGFEERTKTQDKTMSEDAIEPAVKAEEEHPVNTALVRTEEPSTMEDMRQTKNEEDGTKFESDFTAEEKPDTTQPLPTALSADKPTTHSPHASKENRYKELFNQPTEPNRHRPRAASTTLNERHEDDRTTTPALHPATAALYIRDFMRPLQPDVLRAHLIDLATPPNASPDPDIIRDFHLDSIRTHCFALFAATSAAARVRSAIHGRVWPDERTRKPLWADFVPEEKVRAWIETELASGTRPSQARRWEVVYVEREDGVEPVFHEALSGVGAAPPTGPAALANNNNNINNINNINRPAPRHPSGPAAMAPLAARTTSPARAPDPAPAPSFQALDLFRSTTAKPKLYFLPAPASLVAARTAELDKRTARHPPPPGGPLDEKRRYTFEEGDLLVDAGPEFGWRGGRGTDRGVLGERGGGWRGGRGGWRGR
ncbi:hypothetical protein B0A49_11069 [Cryomyces minteri]|uniref:SAP domain-containing protein n=1 Tax=Cryomyces minteri TaxID=331657 RepID=A0A4U0WM65_9PEZI|nr:hypothetical protein B0A49_11069 [Cryomyces minteri]